VLTLAPAYPLAAGLDIYPALATGPFLWRAAHVMPMERRKKLGALTPADLEEAMAQDPPAAVLTGFEKRKDIRQPLIDYAMSHGYKEIKLNRKRTLWVRTAAAP
jgi:hypothetical protein